MGFADHALALRVCREMVVKFFILILGCLFYWTVVRSRDALEKTL